MIATLNHEQVMMHILHVIVDHIPYTSATQSYTAIHIMPYVLHTCTHSLTNIVSFSLRLEFKVYQVRLVALLGLSGFNSCTAACLVGSNLT